MGRTGLPTPIVVQSQVRRISDLERTMSSTKALMAAHAERDKEYQSLRECGATQRVSQSGVTLVKLYNLTTEQSIEKDTHQC